MQIKQLEKPIVENRTGLGKEFDTLMSEVDMPIYNWCREQDRKRKSNKF